MTFWPRVFCAVACWFLSALVIIVTVAHYTGAIPVLVPFDLGQKLLYVIGVGAPLIAVVVGALYLWFWVWARKYW